MSERVSGSLRPALSCPRRVQENVDAAATGELLGRVEVLVHGLGDVGQAEIRLTHEAAPEGQTEEEWLSLILSQAIAELPEAQARRIFRIHD